MIGCATSDVETTPHFFIGAAYAVAFFIAFFIAFMAAMVPSHEC